MSPAVSRPTALLQNHELTKPTFARAAAVPEGRRVDVAPVLEHVRDDVAAGAGEGELPVGLEHGHDRRVPRERRHERGAPPQLADARVGVGDRRVAVGQVQREVDPVVVVGARGDGDVPRAPRVVDAL